VLVNRWVYQETSFSEGMTPGVKYLLIITSVAYLIQLLLDRFTDGLFTQLYAGLSLEGIKHGYVWQLVSYMFLHGGIFHLLMNMLVLYFMGPETERTLGFQHFMILYFLSGILGGLGWLLISSSSWIPCIGASGAIFGVIGAFAAIFPNRVITVLVFFILPVTMRAWVLAVALGGIELLYLLSSSGGVAYAAHLVGGLSGYGYGWMMHHARTFVGSRIRITPSTPSLKVLQGGLSETPPDPSEIDAILDKISEHGMNSLTRRERAILEKASQKPVE
jgi:membrane associated rhomboid family serine protease